MTQRKYLAAAAAFAMSAGLGMAMASPSSAAAWNDTSFQAHSPFPESDLSLGTLTPNTDPSTGFQDCLTLHAIAPGSLHAASSDPAVATAGISGNCLVVTKTTGTGSAPVVAGHAYTFTVTGQPSPSAHNATDATTLTVIPDSTLTSGVAFTRAMQLDTPPNTVYPDVAFTGTETTNCYGYLNKVHATDPSTDPCGYDSTDHVTALPKLEQHAFTVHAVNPASGIAASGQSITASGSTLAPGTYNYATVEGSADGAVASETFSLDVSADPVPVVVPPGDLGDYVNAYGNGLDVFRQHYAAGNIVAGWTATQHDPATLWVRHDTGLKAGGNAIYSIEATRSGGHATGLCLSNPMGGWPDPAGPTGLLVVHCAANPQANKFQQFYTDGSHLVSVINGQAVSPHGTGAQLTASGPASWPGGSDYSWKDYAHLPG